MSPEDEGEFVGSGGFRIAGQRALEVLRSAQLHPAFWRPLLWLRTAAALGAKKVSVETAATGVTFTLHGAPLERALLEQPFALFGSEGERPEARWLAYALVHTVSKHVTVTLSSGAGAQRRAFRFDDSDRGVPAPPAPGTATVVAVAWPLVVVTLRSPAHAPWHWFTAPERHTAPHLGDADAVPFELATPLGAVTPWERRKEPEAGMLKGYGRRVRVRLAEGPSRVTLHHWGVKVHEADMPDPALPLTVDVDDPHLSLDASLNAPVQGPELERSVAGGLAAAERHGRLRLEHHKTTMRLTGRLLLGRPELRRLWGLSLFAGRRAEGRVPLLLRAVGVLRGGRRPSGDTLRVVRAAEFTSYLRAAALKSLRGRNIDARDALRQALWEVPLVFSATGRPLSLADLDLDERPCSLWEKSSPAPAGVGSLMPWALSYQDAWFVKRFPKRPTRVG